jgi:hypothetical protein
VNPVPKIEPETDIVIVLTYFRTGPIVVGKPTGPEPCPIIEIEVIDRFSVEFQLLHLTEFLEFLLAFLSQERHPKGKNKGGRD